MDDRHFALLAKLLDLGSPVLTEKMQDFMLHDGMVEALMGFVSRHPQHLGKEREYRKAKQLSSGGLGAAFESEAEAAGELPTTQPVAASTGAGTTARRKRERPNSIVEEEAVRRSFRMMQLLTDDRPSRTLLTVLAHGIGPIMLQLLSVFDPDSKGNFYHACAILSHVVQLLPAAAVGVIMTGSGMKKFVNVFHHLHEPAVPDSLLALLCAPVEESRRKVSTLAPHAVCEILVPSTFVAHTSHPTRCCIVTGGVDR